MKKSIITLLAVAMVAVSVPAFAQEYRHDASQKTMLETDPHQTKQTWVSPNHRC